MSFRKKCLLSELLDLDLKEGLQALSQEEDLEDLLIKLMMSFWLLWKRFLGGKNQKLCS